MKLFKKRRKESQGDVAKPQLTSLIDVMTLLLVFLMQSFSADSSEITVSSKIELAKSSVKGKAKKAIKVEIRKERVFVMGEALIRVSDIKSQPEKLITEVEKALRKLKLESPQEEKVQIQCDKTVEFAVIKKVLYSSAVAGFKDYSLLVVGRNT